MPVFSIEVPNGKVLDIEADDEATALRGAQEWFAENPLSRKIDFKQPEEHVREQIGMLPEGERQQALKMWADDYVKDERKGGGVAQGVSDYVRQAARGTPIGSWLDELNAATAAAQHKLGLGGAPYDEAVAYQRAKDRAVDEATGGYGTAAKIAGGILSAPVTPIAQVAKVPGALGAAVNAGAAGALYGTAYGAGEGENLEDRARNAIATGAIGAVIGAPLGAGLHKAGEVINRGLRGSQARGDEAARVTEAGRELGVDIPRSVTTVNDDLAATLREVPPLPFMQNPVRRSATAAAKGIEKAGDDAVAGVRARQGDDLAAWLSGKGADAAAPDAPSVAPKSVSVTQAADDGPARIITPDQSMEITARPQLVELSDLKTAGGRFQPRDRGRGEYLTEAKSRAARLDPEQLRPGRVSDSGAPIVLDDGTIISGNGRTLSIAEAYRNPALADRANAYKSSLGPEAANMREPVLVMRADQMTDDVAARFADLSNRGRIAAMSATERAARDAKSIGDDIAALYRGGDFESPQNVDFLRAFTSKAVTEGERAAFSKDGRLTQEGITRMRNAVLASAYDDAPLLSRLVESSDDNVRNITGALTDAAPGFSRLKAGIASGDVPAEMDASKSLVDAVKLIADLRSRGVSPATHFAQSDAFSTADPLVEQWVRAFYNSDLSRPISRQKMADVLNAYAEEAGKKQSGGLFADPTTKGDVLNVAKRAGAEVASDPASEGVGGLLAGMGEGVRPGGPAAPGPAAPASGPATGAGSNIAAEAANVSGSLAETNAGRLAKAIGMAPGEVNPASVVDRVLAMASGKGPDVTSLIKAKQVVGDETWGRVTADVMARMGDDAGKFDLGKMIAAYDGLGENARAVLFGADKRTFDNLATVMPKLERLRDLSSSKLESIPVLGQFLKSRTAVTGLAALAHPVLALKAVLAQVPGHIAAKIISKPAVARDLSRWVNATANAMENPGQSSAVQITARNLASRIAEETDGNEQEIEAQLMGTR